MTETASSLVPAPNQKLQFMLEDTNEGCYRDVTRYLVNRGYTGIPFQKKASQKKKKAQFKYGVVPAFIWSINERDIDYSELLPHQVVNHFDGISKLTTKQGLCEILRGLSWVDENSHDVCPRSYDLSQPSQRAEFTDDFRLCAASSILKYCSSRKTLNSITIFPDKIISYSMTAIGAYLSMTLHGDWSGMLLNGELGILDRGDFGLLDGEWAEVLRASYDLAAQDVLPEWCLGEIYQRDDIALPSVTQMRIRCLLRGLSKVWPQLYMNGMRNIWIVKAPVVSRGTGIKLSCKLEDIFDLEKRIAGRIVQKYVEAPFIVPKVSTYLNLNSNFSTQVKFDIRIWVAITSFLPLKAQVYSTIYGRRCSKAYNPSTKHLGDELIHLTNYSVQRNAASVSAVQASGSFNLHSLKKGRSASVIELSDCPDEDGPPVVSLVEKLRGAIASSSKTKPSIDKDRKGNNSVNSTRDYLGSSSRPELMITHNELMEFLDFKCNGRGREIWVSNIWPEIKNRISSLLKGSREHVTHRDNSFELLGVDVIFDDRLVPWILELNMSPGLSHRNDQHNALIEDMIEKLMHKVLLNKNMIQETVSYPPEEKAGETSSSLGNWEPLDLSVDSMECKERWDGIPVSIPTSRHFLISGEGKINKTWMEILKSGSVTSSTHWRNSDSIHDVKTLTDTVQSGPMADTNKISSSLLEKFKMIKKYGKKNDVCDNNSPSALATSDASGVKINGSLDWSKSLRGEGVSTSGRFITASKRDLLASTSSVKGLPETNCNVATSYMTPTELRLNYYNQINIPLDAATFMAVGKCISKSSVFAIDRAVIYHEKMYLLQRWARRYLSRVRGYHRNRNLASTVIQCLVRQHHAKTIVHNLRRRNAVIAVQRRMRQYLAVLEAEKRRKLRAATVIRNCIFDYITKIRKMKLYLGGRMKVIQRWARRCIEQWYDKAARIIGRQARLWIMRRKKKRLIVRHCIALHYYWRVKNAMIIKRSSCMKKFLKFVLQRRRRKRNLLRQLLAQVRKSNKGLKHVVKIAVKHDIVCIDYGQSFDPLSPLFRYNASNVRNKSPPEVIGKGAESVAASTSFVSAASKALEIVNSILHETEKCRDKNIVDDLMKPSENPFEKRNEDFSFWNKQKLGANDQIFDLMDFVSKHAEEEGIQIPAIVEKHSPLKDSARCEERRTKGSFAMIMKSSPMDISKKESLPSAEENVHLRFKPDVESRRFIDSASDGGDGDSCSDIGDEEEDALFANNDSFDSSIDYDLRFGLKNSDKFYGIQEDHDHKKQSRNVPHETATESLRESKTKRSVTLKEYDVPAAIQVSYHQPAVDEENCHDHALFKKNRKMKSKKKPNKTEIKKKTKVHNPNLTDPELMYKEQLEKQLQAAKEKYAKKQLKREEEEFYRNQMNIIRPDSKPFVTQIQPREAAWDIRNTSKGVNTKTIEIEKAEAMKQAADWNSEILLLQEEKERKQRRAIEHEKKRAIQKHMLSKRTSNLEGLEGVDRGINVLFATPPAEPIRTRPKSAGLMPSRSRKDQPQPSFTRHDIDGGYPIGPYNDDMNSIEGLVPVAPDSSPPVSGQYSTRGTLDQCPVANKERPRPPNQSRPKSANAVTTKRRMTNPAKQSDISVGTNPDSLFESVHDGKPHNEVPTIKMAAPPNLVRNINSSVWTAEAVSANDLTAEEIARIEQEMANMPQVESGVSQKVVGPDDSDDDDDLEVAMAKWLKKQESKRVVPQNDAYGSSRLTNTSFYTDNSFSRRSLSRFDFDNRIEGMHRPHYGAAEAVTLVTHGLTANMAPFVNIPQPSIVQQRFISTQEIEQQRRQRHYARNNGYTPEYVLAKESEQARAEWALKQSVPLDKYMTYDYDRNDKFDIVERGVNVLNSEPITWEGYTGSNSSEALRSSTISSGPSLQHVSMTSVRHDTPFYSKQEVSVFDNYYTSGTPLQRKGIIPENSSKINANKNVPPPLSSTRHFSDKNVVNVELIDVNAGDRQYCIKGDPLQESVQKLRSAYSDLSWDF